MAAAAKYGAAPGEHELGERRTAARARLALAAVDGERILHVRALSEVRERLRAFLARERVAERAEHAAHEALHLRSGERLRRSSRIDPRAKERLDGVDVPHARAQ